MMYFYHFINGKPVKPGLYDIEYFHKITTQLNNGFQLSTHFGFSLYTKMNILSNVSKCRPYFSPILLKYNTKFEEPDDLLSNFETDPKLKKGYIIVGEAYNGFDINTIKKFDLRVSSYYISKICSKGYVNILEWWFKSNLPLKYDESAVDIACMYSQLDVLAWWLKSGLELKYTDEVALPKFRWWINSGLLINNPDHKVLLDTLHKIINKV